MGGWYWPTIFGFFLKFFTKNRNIPYSVSARMAAGEYIMNTGQYVPTDTDLKKNLAEKN
jgi:hypothetical protein